MSEQRPMSACTPRMTPLSEKDIDMCARLMATSEPWSRYGLSFDAARALWRGALQHDADVVVAHQNDLVRGFAWCVTHGGFSLSGYLKLLGVSQEARGRGIGGALPAYVERRAVAEGQHDLLLLVSDFNAPAQHFYQAHGYQEVGALTDYVCPGITELIYRKRLH